MEKMPVLFIGHGSPINIGQQNPFTKDLQNFGKKISKPNTILVISAHWLTRGTFVTCEPQLKQIYDFYGFPQELYRYSYCPAGSPKVAKDICNLYPNKVVQCATDWGLDHAGYMILGHLFPKADIPTIELSLDYMQPPQYHFDLAKGLAPLRQKGVLIVGSGNLIHTFRYVDPNQDAQPYGWAVEYDKIQKKNLVEHKYQDLIHYEQYPMSAKAFQTNDHYLPMLYALALQEEKEELKFIHEGFQHGSISHRSFCIG